MKEKKQRFKSTLNHPLERLCGGKRCYSTWEDAQRAARSVKRHGSSSAGKLPRPYHCRVCGYAHLGSPEWIVSRKGDRRVAVD